MSHHIPEVVIWCLALALAVVAVLLARQRTITTGLRRRVDRLEDGLRARDEELGHLTGVRLPAVADSTDQSVPLPGLLDEQLAGTEFAQRLHSVMDLFTKAVDKAQARADQSAKAALKASMRALQGLAHEQQIAISDMQDRHDNPDVLRDLLEIDHANAQFGRRAQAIAVLCGSWPGRQRVASPLTDVVRGATSRIRDYRRVRVHGETDLAVVSRAVEPVVLAVAELLDNAARHSQPNTTVEVSLQPVHNGACVVIDDAGVGMDGQEVQRAVALLAGRRAVDVSRLGDPPQFGFPVIGVLATRYGFNVSVDTRSPYGGVRAVVFLPSALLTRLDEDDPSTTPLRGSRTRGSGDGPAPAAGRPAAGTPDTSRTPGESFHPAASGGPDDPLGPAPTETAGAADARHRPTGPRTPGTPGAWDAPSAPGTRSGLHRSAGTPDSPGTGAPSAPSGRRRSPDAPGHSAGAGAPERGFDAGASQRPSGPAAPADRPQPGNAPGRP
ncbi:ATP-binding protein [Streptomyces sp. NPDC049577]|uniref:ATP-binding protein n=1 Tax=Streptomyces sp. NPDC049577 TaxID=3155153 RepID=UPI00343804D5